LAQRLVDGAQPKRVREINRIPSGESVEVEAAGEADGVFLGETTGRRIIVAIATAE